MMPPRLARPTRAVARLVVCLALPGGLIAIGALPITACTEDPILLASVPEVEDAGRPVKNVRCVQSSECDPGFFCNKVDCDEPAGKCERYPPTCADATEAIVCGCDGVTYFNDCLRRAAGIASSRPGPCGSDALECGRTGDAACPEGAACARLFGFGPEACNPGIPGTCWILPALCPPSTSVDRWDDCVPHSGKCIDTCNAVRSERAYRRAKYCP